MPTAEPTRFAVDAMLGSLARKLRALGFDAAYYKEGGDSGLLKVCLAERRVLLTSDVALADYASRHGVLALLIEGSDDKARVSALSSQAESAGLTLNSGPPLCSLCSGRLAAVPRKDVLGMVPLSVASHHRSFFVCDICGHVYWKGSHWKKLISLRRRLRTDHAAPLPRRGGPGGPDRQGFD
jgi:uncharacterized protein